MFIRYTHFGIGHPVALRKITRDCLGSLVAAPADCDSDAMDIVDDADLEEAERDDEQDLDEDSDEDELSDEELDGDDGDGDGDEDLFDDHLSF